jgi:transcriptional regulator with XRE-family HTH domain
MATDLPIGTAIRRARERKRWTQHQLADAIGVSRNAVHAWENDRAYPRSAIGALEEVLGISLTAVPVRPEITAGEGWEDWERQILEDPALPERDKREIIQRARRLRADLYPGHAARESLPDDPEADAAAG